MLLTVLAVLSLCMPGWSAVTVIQPYRAVSTNGTARIQCVVQSDPSYDQSASYPSPDPEELRVTLLKGLHGTRELCSAFLNFTEQAEAQAEAQAERGGDVRCSARARDGAVEVTVSGLRAADTDVYRCHIQVFYPPPYLRLTGNGTLLHVLDRSGCPVQEAQRQTPPQGEGGEDDEGAEATAPLSVPVVILLIVITCVLVIIIYFQTLLCERGRRAVRTAPGGLHKLDAASFPCQNVA